MDELQLSQYEVGRRLVTVTADQVDIDRGYLALPDGRQITLSPKSKVGYRFSYLREDWEKGR